MNDTAGSAPSPRPSFDPQYEHLPPTQAERLAHDVDEIGEEDIRHQEKLRYALEATSPELLEEIGSMANGDDLLYDRIVIGAEGDTSLARLIFRQAERERQKGNPKFNQEMVERELAALENSIKRQRESLPHRKLT